MKIEGMTALVTGANRGLGRALVEVLVAAGARTVHAAARNVEQLDTLVARHRDKVIPLRIDITDAAQLAEAAQTVPSLDLLVNNAGVLASFGALTSATSAVEQDFATNFFGLLAATKAFVPSLERAAQARGEAAIVNVLSVVSLAAMPALGTYSASKAAAYSVTQALRADLAPKHIRVHAALPGAIDTDMVRSFAMPKTSPVVVARGIVDGLEQGLDEIAPDPMSRELFATWQRDPKQLERAFAAMQ